MTSEWMKVMLDEIERKRADAEQSQLETSAAAKSRLRWLPRADRRPLDRPPRRMIPLKDDTPSSATPQVICL